MSSPARAANLRGARHAHDAQPSQHRSIIMQSQHRPRRHRRRSAERACSAAPSSISAPPRSRRSWSSATGSGLYRALAAGGAADRRRSSPHARGTHERYVREWLNAHAASGYVSYLADSGRYQLHGRTGAAVRPGGQPGVHRRRLPDRAGRGPHRRPAHRRVQDGRRHRLARARSRACSTASRASTASGYSTTWCRPGFRRSTAWSASSKAGIARRRHRLRPGLLDAS